MNILELHDALISTTRDELESATDDDLMSIECELWNMLAAVESHLKVRHPGYISVLDTEGCNRAWVMR